MACRRSVYQPDNEPEQCYFRLHGRQGWRYQYEPAELADLAELLPRDKAGYVFFNNIHMTQDALTFKRLFESDDPE